MSTKNENLKQEAAPPEIIGWREYVDLPDWGIVKLRAKADTGARSSALDVHHLEELGDGRVRFEVAASRGTREESRIVEARISRRTRVKSSFGASHERLFVVTTLRLAGREISAEVGLVNRKDMLTRMLLGRRFLAGHFLVDSSRCYVHGRRRKSSPRSN